MPYVPEQDNWTKQSDNPYEAQFEQWKTTTLAEAIAVPFEKTMHTLEKNSRFYKLQERKVIQRDKLLKSFDPYTVYKVLKNLKTPTTFSMLKNDKNRLNRSITATSLRQYVDALLTRGYVTISDFKIKDREYTNNFVPRTDVSIRYVASRKCGRAYVRLCEKILDMLSELDPKGPMDRF